MSQRPADIRILDLADPEMGPEVAVMAAAAEDQAGGLVFEIEAIMAAAAGATGLDDFGKPIFVEPLTVLCRSIVGDEHLSPMGRAGMHRQLVGFLVNRLRVEAALGASPEFELATVEAPIVIAGMPRSGTTHLHNLIAADPALRSLPWWEALEPVAPAEEGSSVEGRIERAKQGLAGRDALLPHFNRMHEMTWDHVHEEIHLLAIAGSTMLFDTMGVFPEWREWYLGTDQTPYYEYLSRVLALLQHLRGGDRWVLKSPQHLEQLGPLMAAFPDATVVLTHRDPVPITASFATMVTYSARMSHRWPIDIARIGQWWAHLIEGLLTACVRDRALVPADQSIDVRFHDFMADDLATVEAIYELAGQPYDEAAREAIAQYLAGHERGRHGRVVYDLADFDIDAEERRAALQFYVDRFALTPE